MTDFETGPPETHREAAALIGTFYKASYNRLLGLVRTRFRSLEPEEMVQELFLKILDHLDLISADDPEAVSLIERWTRPDYASRSLINLCLDVVRSGPSNREDATDPLVGAELAGGDLNRPGFIGGCVV
jgi:DNA-directed RNA polymerase specialized sigma24 family protein